jgi:hypothetical protein
VWLAVLCVRRVTGVLQREKFELDASVLFVDCGQRSEGVFLFWEAAHAPTKTKKTLRRFKTSGARSNAAAKPK